jgi:hypothetical protein
MTTLGRSEPFAFRAGANLWSSDVNSAVSVRVGARVAEVARPTLRAAAWIAGFWLTAHVFLAFDEPLRHSPIAYDEEFFAWGGWSINKGLVPYKDFVEFKPPILFLTHALAQKLFGLQDLAFRRFFTILPLASLLLLQASLLWRKIDAVLATALTVAFVCALREPGVSRQSPCGLRVDWALVFRFGPGVSARPNEVPQRDRRGRRCIHGMRGVLEGTVRSCGGGHMGERFPFARWRHRLSTRRSPLREIHRPRRRGRHLRALPLHGADGVDESLSANGRELCAYPPRPKAVVLRRARLVSPVDPDSRVRGSMGGHAPTVLELCGARLHGPALCSGVRLHSSAFFLASRGDDRGSRRRPLGRHFDQLPMASLLHDDDVGGSSRFSRSDSMR